MIVVARSLDSAVPALLSGTVETNPQIVPASVPDGALLRWRVDLLDAERLNPAIQFDYMLEREDPIGTWRHICGGHWSNPESLDLDFDGTKYEPQCSVALTTNSSGGPRTKKNWRVRGRIVLPSPLICGYTLDVIEVTG